MGICVCTVSPRTVSMALDEVSTGNTINTAPAGLIGFLMRMYYNTTFNYRITCLFLHRVHSKLLTQRVRTTFVFSFCSTVAGSLSVIAGFGKGAKPNTLTYFE